MKYPSLHFYFALRATLVAASVLLAGCPSPYATSITRIDTRPFDDERDAPALIQMSDPTVYSRETLINDRRREREYLMGVLDASKTVQFDSEIKRELLSVAQLSAQLGLGLNPARAEEYSRALELSNAEQALNLDRLRIAQEQLGAENQFQLSQLERGEGLRDLANQRDLERLLAHIEQTRLQNQVLLTQLQTELLRAQQQLEALQSGEPPPAEGPSGSPITVGPIPDSSGLGLTSPTLNDPRSLSFDVATGDVAAAMTRLDARITALVGLLGNDAPLARGTDVALTPEADFAARQAYRRTLRSAIAANDLDDQHDADGNSLFRLQFMATIFPGARASKWGVGKVPDQATESG